MTQNLRLDFAGTLTAAHDRLTKAGITDVDLVERALPGALARIFLDQLADKGHELAPSSVMPTLEKVARWFLAEGPEKLAAVHFDVEEA